MFGNLRAGVGALVAVFIWSGSGFAQYAPPPPPPPPAKPPTDDVKVSQYQYGLPPFNYPGSLPSDSSATNPPPPPPMAPRPVADLTPPEFANHPTTTTCDGCRACDSPAAWLFSGEYLLMRPRRRPDDFAIADPVNNLVPEGNVQNIGFDMASGMRVGVGYKPAGTLWESWFTYTYLYASGTATAVAPAGGLLYADLTRPGLVDNALLAVGTDSLTYNIYDMDTVRRVLGDDTMSLRFGFGVRYATIDQNQGAYYDGLDASRALVNSRISFDGAGPTISGEGRYQMPWGLSMFGRVKGGLVVGDVRTSLRETNNAGLTTNANISDKYWATIPVLEMGTGVSWEHGNFRVSAGYEVTNWFNMVDTPTFTNDFAEGKIGRRNGDLSLEGFFLQMGMAY